MKKSILKLGKTLNKVQQKEINGGLVGLRCFRSEDCRGSFDCCSFGACINTTHAIFDPYCS